MVVILVVSAASASVGASFTRGGLGITLLAATQHFVVTDAGDRLV